MCSSSKRPSSSPKARRPASASRGAHGTMGAHKVPSPRSMQVTRPSAPPTRGARRPKTGSLTRAGKLETATPATSSTLGGRAKRRHGRQKATILDGVDATTAMRTARQHRSPRRPVCSAGKSARWLFPSASASRRRSSSTTGRQIPVCGSTTTA
jgi:hypothetical protein